MACKIFIDKKSVSETRKNLILNNSYLRKIDSVKPFSIEALEKRDIRHERNLKALMEKLDSGFNQCR